MKYSLVSTMGNAGLEEFRIHRFGCKDIQNEIKKSHGEEFVMEGENAEAVRQEWHEGLLADNNPYPDSAYRILPCAAVPS